MTLFKIRSIWAVFLLTHVHSTEVQNLKLRRSDNTTLISKSNPFEVFDDRPPECPPCFNCFLPAYKCLNSGECNKFDGRCKCPSGFGGDNCSTPLCGSLPSEDRPPRTGEQCTCDEGWDGINCNVCVEDSTCNSMVPPGLNGTCYKGGLVVQENHQMCDVTNKKIIDMLPDRKPQVTLTCNRENRECGFQFWVKQIESFACELKNCTFTSEQEYDGSNRFYKCENVSCECIPGRMLCGEENSIDITDFLTEEIKGPGDFKCRGNKCQFEEPAMNDLILSVFGDSAITIDCKSGECLYHSQIPGQLPPSKPSYMIYIIAAFSTVGVFFTILGIWLFKVSRAKKDTGYVPVDFDDEADKLMSHHIPSTLIFEDVSYSVGDKLILYNITGLVAPGEMMAIMGASGAGKTSFLDILARRNKTGDVNGTFYVNGQNIGDREFRKVVGYVDQEDTLMPTLTVFETIMTSALLRLPREMSYEAKKGRVMETMSELGILSIKDCRIGSSAARGISGGEKRRVSIACELVTSPSILFLDEPTSGLDAYNAFNVIESLKTLARDYNRTIIFTIHQPRSNIYTMFDKLLLLANGNMVYSGPANYATDYLDSINHPCPPGFNVADYLLDWTQEPQSRAAEESGPVHLLTGISSMSTLGLPDSSVENDLENQSRSNIWGSDTTASGHQIHQEPVPIPGQSLDAADTNTNYLSNLVQLFKSSDLYNSMATTIEEIKNQEQDDAQSTHSSIGRGYKRSSWFTQFKILSTRTFKNLYRDPLLMLANYCMSVLLGLLCGILYYHTPDDISGFQNRMGVFFFMCALFGFSCLTSLQVFQPERILFMRERANGYYSPITYFSSKIIFDIIPLRLIPPILMGIIVYPMVGLNPGVVPFFKFLLVLILFNLTASSVVFLVGILVADLSLSNLICSLIMLFNMLFSGLFLNKTSIPNYLKWLKELSFFNYALESMLVNELKYMQLKDRKFGLVIDIPGASILSSFGFDASAFWPDTIKLGVMFIILIIFSFVSLQLFVKEKR